MNAREAGRWKPWLLRVGAYALDIALLFLLLGPTGWCVQRMLGVTPTTGPQIWATLLLNFSLPSWIYFAVADASRGGATLGKRWLGLRVTRNDGARVGALQALGRTAVKLLPWELAHASAFALGTKPDHLSVLQGAGLAVANAAMITYLVCALVTRGRRSVHDFVAGTVVDRR